MSASRGSSSSSSSSSVSGLGNNMALFICSNVVAMTRYSPATPRSFSAASSRYFRYSSVTKATGISKISSWCFRIRCRSRSRGPSNASSESRRILSSEGRSASGCAATVDGKLAQGEEQVEEVGCVDEAQKHQNEREGWAHNKAENDENRQEEK